MLNVFKYVYEEHEVNALRFFQGLCKFGFYEIFKYYYSDLLGEENAYVYRTWLYLAASASAEFIADVALSPFESAKVGKDRNQPSFNSRLKSQNRFWRST